MINKIKWDYTCPLKDITISFTQFPFIMDVRICIYHLTNLLVWFQENNFKSPLSDNNSSNITLHDNKEATFPINKPLIKLEPSTKMELPIKTEPLDVKPVKLVQPQKVLPIQLPRLKPKPPPVMIVSPQVISCKCC